MLSFDRFDRPSSAEVQADLSWLADAIAAEEGTNTNLIRTRHSRWTPQLTYEHRDREWPVDLAPPHLKKD